MHWILNSACGLHSQGRYTDALKVLDACRQQDPSVVQVSQQKGGPVPIALHAFTAARLFSLRSHQSTFGLA